MLISLLVQFERSAMRCVEIITYETVFTAHNNLSVGSACHTALRSTNDATNALMETVQTLCAI